MNPIAASAEAILADHPDPALRLSELCALISERVDRSLGTERLRAALEEHPDRFRVLDPWTGPWTGLASSDLGDGAEPWVTLVVEAEPPDLAHPGLVMLRESVRWLGRSVDPRSPEDVARWYSIMLAARAAVTRRAA